MSAKILSAIQAIMNECGYVQKSGKNSFHNYRYAGESDLLAVLRPAMLKAGLILLPSLEGEPTTDEQGNTHLVMSYTLAHVSGDVWPEKLRMAGSGGDKNKNGVGDKGAYKAITGANKYLLFKLFQIETGDDPEASEAFVPKTEPKPEKAVPMLERNAFMVECREAIAQFEDAEVLGTWWNSDAQKKARREYQLDSTQVQTLKTAVIDRRAELTKKAA